VTRSAATTPVFGTSLIALLVIGSILWLARFEPPFAYRSGLTREVD
jgi:hypothetical protein